MWRGGPDLARLADVLVNGILGRPQHYRLLGKDNRMPEVCQARIARTTELFGHELWAGTMKGRSSRRWSGSRTDEQLNGSRASSLRLLGAAEFGD
jgi:hypothetical protein